EEIRNAIIKEPITELLQRERSIWIDPHNRVGDGFLHVGESMRRARRNDDHVALRDAAADAAANAAASESRTTELLHNIARRFAFLWIHECSAGHKCLGAFDYVVDLRNFFMRGHPREVSSFVAMHNRVAGRVFVVAACASNNTIARILDIVVFSLLVPYTARRDRWSTHR